MTLTITKSVVSYDTLLVDSQYQVLTFLRNSSTIGEHTDLILDGQPLDLIEKRSFPFILVKTPEVEEENLTVCRNGKRRATITMDIEIYSSKEGMGREVADAVRKALKDNRNTSMANWLYWSNIQSTDLVVNSLPNSKKPFYIYTITAAFKVVLS